MVNVELKEESKRWVIKTDRGVILGTYRLCSLYKAKEWCKAYLSSWNEIFCITVIYDGKSYSFDDEPETKSST
jgi:hypothetical protein